MEQFYLPAHFAPRVCPLHLINPKHNVPLSDGTDLEPALVEDRSVDGNLSALRNI